MITGQQLQQHNGDQEKEDEAAREAMKKKLSRKVKKQLKRHAVEVSELTSENGAEAESLEQTLRQRMAGTPEIPWRGERLGSFLYSPQLQPLNASQPLPSGTPAESYTSRSANTSEWAAASRFWFSCADPALLPGAGVTARNAALAGHRSGSARLAGTCTAGAASPA